jgi:phosphoglycerate dehydrogenase-like enzyme
MPDASRLVLITTRLPESVVERLRAVSPELRIEQPTTSSRPWGGGQRPTIPDELWAETEVLYALGNLPAPEQAPKLRWVQLHSAGANQLLDKPIYQTDVMFTTASGVHAIPIAEYVLTMTLAWFHHVPRMLEWQGRGQWPPNDQRFALFAPEELAGKTIGIVGYGSIGRQVARLAVAFGMRELAMQRSSDHRDHGYAFPGVGDPEGTLPERYYTPDALNDLLRASDVVVIAVPLTPATRHMFGDAQFEAMKPSALLVNIARGDVCDEAALTRALAEHRIGGAALDVFEREPLPADSPLWRLDNVLISPHISGLTPHYDERAGQIFEANLRRYLAGEPLYNLVDRNKGY